VRSRDDERLVTIGCLEDSHFLVPRPLDPTAWSL
jgi:hypothetical protein